MLLISPLLMIVIGIAAVSFLLIIILDFPISMAQTTTTTTASGATESFWTAGAPMPTPRTEVTAAFLDGNIYVIGGFAEFDQVTDLVEVYNIENNTWSKTTAAPLPEALHHTAAASYNGKIYVAGGYTAPWSPSNKLFIYDPAQNS
jgi:N-acetylneuraminic acid mutarotase